MKSDITVAQLLNESPVISKAELIISQDITDFSSLATVLGLDKNSDFRHSDLNGVDFSHADLRNYDFQGADLRNSYGACVLLDETTNLDGADLEGSCFATFKRERDLFKENSQAQHFYNALKSGDPYEISSWIYARFGGKIERQSIFNRIDDISASILCQKLISDDIDLTKRADLFYNLISISGSKIALREIILGIIATCSEKTEVVKKFISIASEIYNRDEIVSKALLKLCIAANEEIRKAAFIAIGNTKLFLQDPGEIRKIFMNNNNASIRKSLIRTSAIACGTAHLRCVNSYGLSLDVNLEKMLDVKDLLNFKTAHSIAMKIAQRTIALQRPPNSPTAPYEMSIASISTRNIEDIIERQEEVMCRTPLIATFFLMDNPIRARSAKYRLISGSKKERSSRRHRRSSH